MQKPIVASGLADEWLGNSVATRISNAFGNNVGASKYKHWYAVNLKRDWNQSQLNAGMIQSQIGSYRHLLISKRIQPLLGYKLID